MAEEVFTDQEDKLTEQIKSTIFYSENDVYSETKSLLRSAKKERAADILETTLSQIGFEQKQRRDYVLSALGIDPERAKAVDSEVFVRTVGTNPSQTQSIISSAKLDPNIFKPAVNVPNEALEQAKAFATVYTNLEDLYSKAIYQKRLKPIVGLLKKLPADRLNSVISQTKDYIKRVEQLGDDIIIKNPDFSNAIKQLFELTGLSIISSKKDTIGEKLGFCGDVLLAAGLLESSYKQEKGLTDRQLERAAGSWLYNLEGSPPAEEILAD